MVSEHPCYQPSLTSKDKHYHERNYQTLLAKFSRTKHMFRLIYTMVLIVFYSIIRAQNSPIPSDAFHFINVSSTILKRGPNVPLVTLMLHDLPATEPKLARYRSLTEHAYGTRDNDFDYPIGARLLSNLSEYRIPSDRAHYRKNDNAIKYFHEIQGQPHMDIRYGKLHYAQLSNAKRVVILHGLLTAWSNFTDEKQIPYWIAHGTLLGWWWGGSFLPWDSDIDVQMNAKFLYVLARFTGTILSGRYLIDVNPNFRARHPQKNNVIDARLVDTHTGYFIDITGMADTGIRIPSDPHKLLLCDKHIHRTFYSDLHPLVRIEFQGIKTWRPDNVERYLITEYESQALHKTAYQGYIYNVVNATWTKNEQLLMNPLQVFHAQRHIASSKVIRSRPSRNRHPLT